MSSLCALLQAIDEGGFTMLRELRVSGRMREVCGTSEKRLFALSVAFQRRVHEHKCLQTALESGHSAGV